MAVDSGPKTIVTFDDWYVERMVDERTGCLRNAALAPCAEELRRAYTNYKREMDARVENYYKLEQLADGEVLSQKADLPNVSSGETAGIVRRIARNLVQHTPNLEVISRHDDDSVEGVVARHILVSKVVGDDLYSNDMQQNLFSSTKTAFTLGFDSVIPVLMQDAGGSWFIKYDTIHYRDVFPEPGVKDIRQATDVFVRRYLTKGEVHGLIRMNVAGWDHEALKTMVQVGPPGREQQSVSQQDKKRRITPEGYEIITWYSNTGQPFLTWEARTGMLLRIEKNKHPLKWHPVHFLILEKDSQQPLGKSQVELLLGRQEFQDLMLNGAMKLWYRNINPPLIGYGTVNSIPNLSPGKYTQISNPNAKIEAFEVNTQTLLQYGQISAQNLGSMVSLVGAADQQMAQSSGAGGGMSATPQGVEAQAAMVDITTNNYQKAIESFFSHYCSYALTIYFQELKSVKELLPTADARVKMINGGLDPQLIDEDGVLKVDFSKMAIEYWVRCVPGSLVELEDEKQLRVLNELFVPLSQAMPALAASQDPESLKYASQAMRFIIEQEIRLSGAAHSTTIAQIFREGETAEVLSDVAESTALEQSIGALAANLDAENGNSAVAIAGLQQSVSLLSQMMAEIVQHLGVNNGASGEQPNSSPQEGGVVPGQGGIV